MAMHWHTGLSEMLQMYHIHFVQGFNYEGIGKVLRLHQLYMRMSILSWIKTITNKAQSNSYINTQGCQCCFGVYNGKCDGTAQLQIFTSTSCHDAMKQSRYWQRFKSSKLYQCIFSCIKTIFHEAPRGSYIATQAQGYQRCFQVMHKVRQHLNHKISPSIHVYRTQRNNISSQIWSHKILLANYNVNV